MRLLSILVGAALLAASGLVHGILTERWSSSGELQAAVARLDRIPITVGDWTGRALELNREQLRVGRIAGYIHRRYENRRTGATATILVVCGSPGPISVHTPDACYGGIGYEPMAPQARYSTPTPRPAEFWRLDLRKPPSPEPGYLRVFYAWNAAGGWKAPAGEPRLVFSRAPFLYKLYVIREMRVADEPLEGDPGLELARQLLSPLDGALFPEA